MKDRSALALAATLLLIASPALAHTGAGAHGGLAAGFLHPLTGPDHIVAMIAVGLWAALLGGPAIRVLPVVFPLAMALGALAGMTVGALPGVETGIALSGLVLGLMVVTRARPRLAVASLVVGVFAVFHGIAHGAELPAATHPAIYAAGFLVATVMMHGAGLLLGRSVKWPAGMTVVRLAGAGIAVAGGAFLVGIA